MKLMLKIIIGTILVDILIMWILAENAWTLADGWLLDDFFIIIFGSAAAVIILAVAYYIFDKLKPLSKRKK